jgi:dimethylhistidine N-methyltransferase
MKTTDLFEEKCIPKINEKEKFSIDVLTGLSSNPKKLSSKYFYDDVGSKLFQQITQLKEYYLTECEREIFERHKASIAEAMDEKCLDIIELGAGDGHKTKLLIEQLIKNGVQINYYPIDISEKAFHLLEQNIVENELLAVQGIVGDYMNGLEYIREHSSRKKLLLCLGSNLGNFDRIARQVFLRRVWRNLNSGDLALIGFDQKKDIDILTKAYNDSQGITKKFNLNILTRINKELGGNFEVKHFTHFGSYNPLIGTMESFLVSLQDQEIYIEDIQKKVHFAMYEPLHLEYSFKFLPSDIKFLAGETGFKIRKNYQDERGYFIDSLWEVHKQ